MTDLFTHRAWSRRGLPVFLAGLLLAAPVQAGERAWTQRGVSIGLSPQRPEVSVRYEPGVRDPFVAPGSRIVRVHARRDWNGGAIVETRLCHGSVSGPCVPLRGTQLNTHRFDGLPARGPFVMVHRVAGWADALPPLFVSGSVTVWFGRP